MGTAPRALHVLAAEGCIAAVPGHGFRATDCVPVPSVDELALPAPSAPKATVESASGTVLLDVTLRYRGQDVSRFSVEADPRSAEDLRQVLLDAIARRGSDVSEFGAYEIDLRLAGDGAEPASGVVSRYLTS